MFAVETFLSMLFVKCKSRGEQLGLIIGMLIMIAACYGVGKFMLGLGEAGLETANEVASMERSPSGMERDSAAISLFGYATVAACVVFGAICSIMATINLVRLLTGTGLADPNDTW